MQVPRNGQLVKELRLADKAGAAIDLTGHALVADARLTAGTGSVIASATIVLVEPTDGRFSMTWDGADFDAVGALTEIVRAAWDLKHTYPGGSIDVPVRGELIIFPEVTA